MAKPKHNFAKAVWVFSAVLLLAAPLGVALSGAYKGYFAFEAWVFGYFYPDDELQFMMPENILKAVFWTYIFTAIPVLVTAALLAWKTWRHETFSYTYAALAAAVSTAVYAAVAAYVFRHELVRVVTAGTAASAIVIAILVSLIGTAALKWAGIITLKE